MKAKLALHAAARRLGGVPPVVRFGVAGLLVVGVVALQARSEDAVDFNRDVRPILNDKCIACHGGVKRSSGFGVLFREDALVAGESGRIGIVPGDPDASEMIRRITHPDPAERMPHEGPPLSSEEIRTLRRWIEQGAQWGQHWAYRQPETRPLPEVAQEGWATGGIDRFVLARLQDEELEPSPAAPCPTLIRRVSLDLIGLPPSVEETDAFCADPSAEAYAAAVDRLLASPRYGEHWASMWLDLARYADTKGYEKDQHRDMWPYRDWVIRALNEDMPFDQFTIEQMAGDLLPGATDEQILATAYHRNTMTNDEDGTDDEEFRVAAVIDRVNTTMEVWQATTMKCVQCHSHPYDPFRHDEYYQLFAFFNNTADGDRKNDSPLLPGYGGEQRQRIVELLSEIDELGVETLENDAALSHRLQEVFFPLGWMPAADFDASLDIMTTGDYIAPLADRGWVRYSDIELGGVAELGLGYSGREGVVEVRLDDAEGPLIGRVELPESSPRPPPEGMSIEPTLRVPIEKTAGRRDLVLVLLSSAEGSFRVTSVSRYPAAAARTDEVAELKWSLAAVPTMAETPILREVPPAQRRVTQMFVGGNWMVHGDTVQAGVPGSMPSMPDSAPRNRLGLARWLVSDDNPLTGRVMVNRLWARLFGTGIVATLGDFGTQGEAPSHPALLDWMALRFVGEHDWSLKAMLREMVLSATYQQSSRVTPGLQEIDPQNRLLARGPRVRLSAEQVRDQALAVGGLLSDSMYGPGSMPPQPPGVWNSPYNSREWTTTEDGDRYRRAVYTYWKRTAPYPSMVAFDSPSREFCVVDRIQTNTPLQALVTLNDPVYVEAAQALARRMSDHGGALEDKLHFGYRTALLREPEAAAVARLTALYESVAAAYRDDPALLDEAIEPYRPYDEPQESAANAAGARLEFAARAIVEPPAADEVAALTTVATVIMNLDGFLTKD